MTMEERTERIAEYLAVREWFDEECRAEVLDAGTWSLLAGLTDEERDNGWAHPIPDPMDPGCIVVRYSPQAIAHRTATLDADAVVARPGTVAGYLVAMRAVLVVEVINFGLVQVVPDDGELKRDVTAFWVEMVLSSTPMAGMLPAGFLR